MVRLSRKQRYGVSYGMIQCLPPWGSDGAQGMRVTAASSSTGSWAAWGLPVGTGQAMGRGKHHSGWRHWEPGTANQPAVIEPFVGPTDLLVPARPRDQPNRQAPYPSALASPNNVAPRVSSDPTLDSEVLVQGAACMPQGGTRYGTWHPRCMSKVHVQGTCPRCMSEVHVRGRSPRDMDTIGCMCGAAKPSELHGRSYDASRNGSKTNGANDHEHSQPSSR